MLEKVRLKIKLRLSNLNLVEIKIKYGLLTKYERRFIIKKID
jgi:hypothetical protein